MMIKQEAIAMPLIAPTDSLSSVSGLKSMQREKRKEKYQMTRDKSQ